MTSPQILEKQLLSRRIRQTPYPPEYSFAIFPDDPVGRELIKTKKRLVERIGWYPSCNSDPHITLYGFDGTQEDLQRAKAIACSVCDSQSPFRIHLDKIGHFPQGTLLFHLDDSSRYQVTTLQKRLFSETFPDAGWQFFPHLSIARTALTENELELASESIYPIRHEFVCKEIFIRRFSRRRRQYNVVDKIGFGGASERDRYELLRAIL